MVGKDVYMRESQWRIQYHNLGREGGRQSPLQHILVFRSGHGASCLHQGIGLAFSKGSECLDTSSSHSVRYW